ncbi:MAG: restriction endonuclease subunit S [Candidatus Brocadia sp. WS118]|nr:MAG: restriction endonuclease subunit S [Candidatus Brocadia sp. WS118]
MRLLKHWPHVKLGLVCSKIGSGATPRGGENVYLDEGTAIIRSQNVYNGLFMTEGLAYITEEHAEQLKGVTIELRDILLNITGDSVARCCQVPNSVLPARVNQHVAIVRPDRKKLLPEFLCYYMISPLTQKYLLSRAGSGGTRNALTKAMIENLEVPCPSLNIQERIASILSAYDDLIDNNRRRIQLLEQAARLLYKEWFVHLRFPGHEHVKIIDGVPEGWEKVPLSYLCTDVRESAIPKDLNPDTAYIGLEHIPRRSITLDTWGTVSEIDSNKFKFAERDILFGKIRPYFHKVGFSLVDGIASSDAIVIRPTEDHIYYYTLFLLSSDEFVALASKTVREGSKMPRADWKFLLKSEFKRPPETVLSLFNDVVSPICDQLQNLALQNRKLFKARDLLLPRLMNGEFEI